MQNSTNSCRHIEAMQLHGHMQCVLLDVGSVTDTRGFARMGMIAGACFSIMWLRVAGWMTSSGTLPHGLPESVDWWAVGLQQRQSWSGSFPDTCCAASCHAAGVVS